ncbi:TSC22 domain family protein 4-like [Crotalus adamanteus]|uniref:TSC22 domain family protein 3 n=1 Tax=Crotalus adamanteus TaxID=8729 RepID=A0AAW1B8G0_CROAD
MRSQELAGHARVHRLPRPAGAARIAGLFPAWAAGWARPFACRWVGRVGGSEGPGGDQRTGQEKGKEICSPAAAFFGGGVPPSGPRGELGAERQAGEMSLDRRRASVRSLVNAYESRGEPPGCGCCLLPDPGASPRPRQRGCTSPASSREASPARVRKPKETPPSPQKPNGCPKKEADQRLVSLLLVLHSGSNSSMIAIDNKIEQAMDLVKSHLMFAVREEVELLREQIKELSERNAALEQENSLLRSLAGAEQTGPFPAQLHENKPSSSGSA